jgi:hypothetical protein
MKRIFIASLFLITSLTSTFAQVVEMTYSEKKEMYNYRNYRKEYGDPYSPGLAGVASFFIPGLGQIICDETNRGLAFLGGYAGCAVLYGVGVFQFSEALAEYETTSYGTAPTTGTGKMLLGMVGMCAVSIWSIVDAVHVAKVNNLYLRDKFKKTSLHLEVTPYMEQVAFANTTSYPIGMTLKATF